MRKIASYIHYSSIALKHARRHHLTISCIARLALLGQLPNRHYLITKNVSISYFYNLFIRRSINKMNELEVVSYVFGHFNYIYRTESRHVI